MARQVEGFLEGTYDDITFYRMEGKYFARMKSSLTGEQFWTHKAFAGSRRSCSRFGRGNQLASMVYKEIPEGKREYQLFCRMKSVAIRMIKEGKEEDEVVEELRRMKPILKRRIVGRKVVIRQLVNSTIRQWRGGGDLKMRGFEDLKMMFNRGGRRGRGGRERLKLTGDDLKMRGFEDLKMEKNGRIRQLVNSTMRKNSTIRQFGNSAIGKERRLRFRSRLRGADHDHFAERRFVVVDDS